MILVACGSKMRFGVTMKALYPLLAFLIIAINGCNAHVSPTLDSNGLEVINARVNVKSAVEDSLKAPATASFSWSMDFRKIDDDTFETSSYVDAENSFGAKIRTHFSARVDKRGHLKSLNIKSR